MAPFPAVGFAKTALGLSLTVCVCVGVFSVSFIVNMQEQTDYAKYNYC